MRALILTLVSVLLIAGCSLSDSDGSRDFFANGERVANVGDNPYEAGKQHLLASNYGLAIGYFRTALRYDPGSPTVLNGLAIAYDGMGRRDIAQGFFTRALAADPRSVQTLNNMARSLISAGATAKALPYLKQAAALDPSNPIVRANLQALAGERLMDTGGVRSAAVRPGYEGGWIERTTEVKQTLVTHTSGRDGVTEDALPPPTSFVDVASAASVATDVKLAAWSRPAAPAAAAVRPQAPRARRPSLGIANGNGRTGMAARVRDYLESQCWAVGRLQNADRFTYARTTIGYRAGFLADAMALASSLPIAADVVENINIEPDIILRIGRDLLTFESALEANTRVKGKSYDQFTVSRDDRGNSADGSARRMCGFQSAALDWNATEGREHSIA